MTFEDAINKRNEIDAGFEGLHKRWLELRSMQDDLEKKCPHDIIVLFHDEHSRRNNLVGVCYCPTCIKLLNIIKPNHFQKSIFANSKVIDIRSNKTYSLTSKALISIQKEVFSNLDFYLESPNYDKSKHEINEQEKRMMDILSEYELKDRALKRQLF